MGSLLYSILTNILAVVYLCKGQNCSEKICPEGSLLVLLENFTTLDMFDAGHGTQIDCYGKDDEAYKCLSCMADQQLFQILLRVVCSLSIAGDVITLISSCLFYYIHNVFHLLIVNMCLANLAFNLVVVILGSLDEVHGLCYAVSVLLHFFLLSQFMLMSTIMLATVSSFYEAIKLKRSTKNSQHCFVAILLLFGWSVPLLMIIVALVVDNTTNQWIGYGSYYNCWITNEIAEIVFIEVPFSIIMLFNIIAFAILIALIIKAKGATKRFGNNGKNLYLQFTIAIFCVSGITWTCVLLKYMITNCWFSRSIILLNCLQGLTIFIVFYCRKKLLDRYRKLLCCNRKMELYYDQTM